MKDTHSTTQGLSEGLKVIDGSGKPRFKKGRKVHVISPSGEYVGRYTIQNSNLNRAGIFMYAFKETKMCVGEFWLKYNMTDPTLTITECLHIHEDRLSNIFEGIRAYTNPEGDVFRDDSGMEGTRMPSGSMTLQFFRPDEKFIQWIRGYAGDRLICDIGCGTGRLIERMADMGSTVCGIEPFFTHDDYAELNMNRIKRGKDMLQILSKRVEECDNLIQAFSKRALFLFCRPCHGLFVFNALSMMPSGSEALYITLPENLDKYDDCGPFMKYAKQLTYDGRSADEEVVYSITIP